jgi:hypothetical protein
MWGDFVYPLVAISDPFTASRDSDDDEEFRTFRKQLYHAQISKILEPLRPHMTEPVLMRCADGYFRCVIFELGPFIADYPEQVYLAGVVQGWCPKSVLMFRTLVVLRADHVIRCRAAPNDLGQAGRPRTREHLAELLDTYPVGTLWDVFGVNGDVEVSVVHLHLALV